MLIAQEIKKQIIEVADTRFRRYGFGKTTMAEIAKDCHMSAANLYRYFENKEKIGIEIALKCLHQKEQIGEAVLERDGLSAGERLETFFIDILHYTYDICANDEHLFELVAFISQEHKDIVRQHQASLLAFIGRILEEGIQEETFDIQDVSSKAETILFAMVHFYYPPLVMMNNHRLDQLEHAAKNVVRLLIQGLAKH